MTLIALLVIANFALGALLIWDYYRRELGEWTTAIQIEILADFLSVRTDPNGLKRGEWAQGLRGDNYLTWVRMWIGHQRAIKGYGRHSPGRYLSDAESRWLMAAAMNMPVAKGPRITLDMIQNTMEDLS